jgi:Vps16, C-terminal region
MLLVVMCLWFALLNPLYCLQVPLLLSMGEDERALQRAITSGDCDLVTLALLHIERSSYTNNNTNTANSSGNKGSSSSVRDQDAVYKLVHAYPEALSLLKVSQH